MIDYKSGAGPSPTMSAKRGCSSSRSTRWPSSRSSWPSRSSRSAMSATRAPEGCGQADRLRGMEGGAGALELTSPSWSSGSGKAFSWWIPRLTAARASATTGVICRIRQARLVSKHHDRPSPEFWVAGRPEASRSPTPDREMSDDRHDRRFRRLRALLCIATSSGRTPPLPLTGGK